MGEVHFYYNLIAYRYTIMEQEKFSLLRFTISLAYNKKRQEIKWYQFKKLRELNKWLDEQNKKIK